MNWLAKLFGGGGAVKRADPPAGTPVTADEMKRLIPAFGKLMEEHAAFGVAVFDEDTLPARKSRLELVLRAAIGVASDEAQANILAVGLVSLAQYQPGVGKEPQTLLPPMPDHPASLNEAELRAAAAAMAAHAAGSSYDQYRQRVEEDERRLKALADEAIAKWRSQSARRGRR